MGGLILALVILLSAASPPARAQTLRAGYVSKTIFFLPFFVAQKKGFYEAEGLKVELIHMGSPAISLQALVAGQIHLSIKNPDGIIIFNEKGGNLKAISGVVNGVAYTLIGGKAYRKIEDLKGTRLGVAALKGGATSFLLEYLRMKGLLYPRDYALAVIAGGTPARLAALEAGSISAAVLAVPHGDIAIDRGFSRLGDIGEAIPAYQFTAINVDPAWAEKNRPAVVKFLKAHIRATGWIYEDPAGAAEIATSEVGLKPPYARIGIDYLTGKGLYPKDGSITMEGMRANIAVLARDGLLAGPVPSPEKHVDLSYLKQARKELGEK